MASHVVDVDVDVDNDDEQGAQVRQGQDGAGWVASQGDREIERNKLGGRRQGAPNKLYLMMMFVVIMMMRMTELLWVIFFFGGGEGARPLLK